MKNKCAFIGHPLNLNQLYAFLGKRSIFFKFLSKERLKKYLKKLSPQKITRINDLKSNSGISLDCFIIACPLLVDQFVSLPEEFVLLKILDAVKYCEKLGAKLAVLGGFTSIIGNEGEIISQKAKIPVTSGNTYTACLAIDGTLKAAKLMGIDLSMATAAVIGATGDIGSICTKILAKKVKKINIAARNEKKLEDFSNKIKKTTNCEIRIFKYINDTVKNSDIILTATSSLTTIIDAEKLKSNSVVCDITVPASTAHEIAKIRDDILVFEGGLAKPPAINGKLNKKHWKDGLPHQSIYGCMAEGLVLSLAGRFENYSIGRGNITEDKIDEIRNIANRLGFGLSDFFCGDKVYTEKDIIKIKRS